jgi:pimeloyl-ACP methyl ester carboxylesterase
VLAAHGGPFDREPSSARSPDASRATDEAGRWRARRLARVGDPAGQPVFFLHGTPGSRLFCPDPDPGVRLITLDRPGYGLSTPLEVPTLSSVAELLGESPTTRASKASR